MAKLLLITLLVTLLASSSLEARSSSLGVFGTGKLSTTYYQVEESDQSAASPPKPLLIVTPINVEDTYPVFVFLHGTCLSNYFYTDILEHISSHGYIVVAPQLYSCLINRVIPMLPISGPRELEFAAEVMNWLPSASGLQSVLPENIKADLNKLSVGGHSRGGKTAFALALGYANIPLKLKILALAALDPVEGMSKNNPTLPKTFTYLPQSLDLSIPVTVIGTGLGNQPICWLVCPACAPNEVNHEEFFNECRAPTTHFVAAEYGHMDMLNENIKDLVGRLTNSLCKSSQSPKEPMRKTVGGIVVAFLKAYFEGQSGDYLTIVQEPSVAPVKLDPVQFTEA